MSGHCTDLIKRLLVKDPDERISIKDALGHEFFTQFDPQPEKQLVIEKKLS